MGAVVLDASVVIALFDPRDAHHQAASTAVRSLRQAGSDFVLPASVLSEVLVGAFRQGADTAGARRQMLHAAFGPSRPVDDDVAVAAARLRAAHRALRLPDALVVAVGVVDGAQRVLTADKRWTGLHALVQVLE